MCPDWNCKDKVYLKHPPDEVNNQSLCDCAKCTNDIGLKTDRMLFIKIQRLHIEQMLVECICIHDAHTTTSRRTVVWLIYKVENSEQS